MKRICCYCKLEKELEDFYPSKTCSLNGRRYICKKCDISASAERSKRMTPEQRKRKSERAKERLRLYKKGIRISKKKATYTPEDVRAYAQDPIRKRKNYIRYRTWELVERGIIKKDVCEVCQSKKVEAHHIDYNKPLEVMWLCKKHHVEWHKNNVAIKPIIK